MVETLVLAVAAEIAVLLLQGKQVIGDGNQVGTQLRVARALIGAGGCIHPFAGVFTAPAALAFGDDFGGEQGDGFALGAVDIMGQTAVVTGIDSVSEQAADHDGKDHVKHDSGFKKWC